MRAKFGWMGRLAALGLIVLWSISAMGQGLPTQTRRVMRHKLDQSGSLLAALVTSNWGALDKHGRALKAVTTDPAWDLMRLPDYHKYSAEFIDAVDAVIEAAQRHDQREALTAYNGLVASCVECHRYVARARVVKGP
jgi:hypothetical protein